MAETYWNSGPGWHAFSRKMVRKHSLSQTNWICVFALSLKFYAILGKELKSILSCVLKFFWMYFILCVWVYFACMHVFASRVYLGFTETRRIAIMNMVENHHVLKTNPGPLKDLNAEPFSTPCFSFSTGNLYVMKPLFEATVRSRWSDIQDALWRPCLPGRLRKILLSECTGKYWVTKCKLNPKGWPATTAQRAPPYYPGLFLLKSGDP